MNVDSIQSTASHETDKNSVPLHTNLPQLQMKRQKDAWKSIQKHLNDTKEGENISFDQLLFELNLTEETTS